MCERVCERVFAGGELTAQHQGADLSDRGSGINTAKCEARKDPKRDLPTLAH